jgi:hypothetical protein
MCASLKDSGRVSGTATAQSDIQWESGTSVSSAWTVASCGDSNVERRSRNAARALSEAFLSVGKAPEPSDTQADGDGSGV